VYDCMDELASFRNAPPEIVDRERLLFSRVDLVFTGGHSLYRAKRSKHRAVYPFPSSVDGGHFAQARNAVPEPADQAPLRRPRLGFYGVIDERMDMALLDAMAAARPEWEIVMVGPFARIEPDDIPHRPNLHWLGAKEYAELPAYLAGWNVAIMPFALNESTRFISPTKTLEYLAAGKPVVSTPIGDVVRPYGIEGVVRIAHAGQFVSACEAALTEDAGARLALADSWVSRTSWDTTWKRMADLVDGVYLGRGGVRSETGVACSVI
jgi:glycosyltransferase involved in cell wall biosynthesis